MGTQFSRRSAIWYIRRSGAASSSSMGMLVWIAPWNMKVAMEMEKPVCIRIRVMRLFSTPKVPPYRDTRGIINTWKGITMEAIIPANRSPQLSICYGQ